MAIPVSQRKELHLLHVNWIPIGYYFYIQLKDYLSSAGLKGAPHNKRSARLQLDAVRIGRLHTRCEGWADANLQYMLSGGYTTSSKVASISSETLIIWGREDKILDPTLYAER